MYSSFFKGLFVPFILAAACFNLYGATCYTRSAGDISDPVWGTTTSGTGGALPAFNFDHFLLQHSPDGIAFHEIVRVKGHGTTREKHDYQYADPFPVVGKNYYRLVSVDFDNCQEAFQGDHAGD